MNGMLDWFGPVAGREFLQIARRRRFCFLRMAYGLLVLFVTFTAWNEGGRKTGIRAMASLTETFVDRLAVVQILACGIVAAISLCDSICLERRSLNLEIWLTTPLTAKDIVHGKLASRMALLLLVLATGAPVVALLTFFGGVNYILYLALTLLAFLVGTAIGACAVSLSAGTNNGLRALLGTLVRTFLIGSVIVPAVSIFVTVLLFHYNYGIVEWRLDNSLAFVTLMSLFLVAAIVFFLRTGVVAVATTPESREDFALDAGSITSGRSPDDPRAARYRIGDRTLERFFGRRYPLWWDRRLELEPRRPTSRQRLAGLLEPVNRMRGCLLIVLLDGFAVALLIGTAAIFDPGFAVQISAGCGVFLWLASGPIAIVVLVIATTTSLLGRDRELLDLIRMTDLTSNEIVRGIWLTQWPVLQTVLVGYLSLGAVALPANVAYFGLRTLVGALALFALAAMGLATRLPRSECVPPLVPPMLAATGIFLWPLALQPIGVQFLPIAGAAIIAIAFAARRSVHPLGLVTWMLSTNVALASAVGYCLWWAGCDVSIWMLTPAYWIFGSIGNFDGLEFTREPLQAVAFLQVPLLLANVALLQWHVVRRFRDLCRQST